MLLWGALEHELTSAWGKVDLGGWMSEMKV